MGWILSLCLFLTEPVHAQEVSEEQARVDALVSSLQEVRDERIRRHPIQGIAFLPAWLVMSHVREIDQEIKRVSRGLDGAVELGEIYLSDTARSAKQGRLIGGSLRVAGSLAFYAVSVDRALGPVFYNLGGLMVIGSVVLTFRESREERILQAYEQRLAEIEDRSTRTPDSR